MASHMPVRREQKAFVNEKCPQKLRKMAQRRSCEPLFCEGVPLMPAMPPPPQEEQQMIGNIPTDGTLARGNAYTDGAIRSTMPKALRVG